ncbi:unnamed protein product [Prunus brigantina]
MAKRFKFRISRVIPSFQSCRSKDPSTLPSNPVPSFLSRPPPLVNHVNFPATTPLPPPLPSKIHHHSSIKRHVLFCGIRSRPTLSDDDRTRSPPDHHHKFEWEREDKWHVVAKVYDINPRSKIYTSSASASSDVDDTVSPPPSSVSEQNKKTNQKRRVKNKKKKTTTSRIRISTSSFETGIFSSEGGGGGLDDEETETLVSTRSSRSFSTDSSPPLPRRKKKKKRGSSAAKRSVSRRSLAEMETAAPARLSVFQRLIPCTVEGKVRESFAVVKKSEDPYEDFKRSMMEMILEKQMFDERELEQLLHCFLSLNSREHHGVIVEAFAEIWEALFCCATGSARSSSGARVSRAL